ncbi:hypothetical protein [Viscerimonas tarda]
MKQLTFILTLLFCSLPASAQQDSARQKLYSFVENINAFTDYYPQEKVYLHFDNSSYFMGENIWFKCYVNVADANIATDVSRTLYVELLDPEGNVADSRKLLVENGQCHGEFLLAGNKLHAGFYQVRAYTRYMLNFDEECVFSRVFPVYDQPEKEGDYSKKKMTALRLSVPNRRVNRDKSNKINVNFFPEGGNLVRGIESKVAFKATDENGMSVEVKGKVYNSKKELVADFQSTHQGMGYFYLTPTEDNYTAEIEYNNKKHSEKLPKSNPAGYVMQVDNSNSEVLQVAVYRNNNTFPETIGITASCRGRVNAFAELNMATANRAIAKFPLKELETGVNQLTIYDREGRVLSERLVFINRNDKQLTITKKQNKRIYSPLEKVDMDFELTGPDNQPVETGFSLSIKDAGTITATSYADNILTNMLLSSDLKGYIENPAYYFEKDDEQRKSGLDLLVLTQGWRRYVWERMAGLDDFQLNQPAEKGILIDGFVKSFTRNKKKKGVDIAIILQNDSLGILHEATLTDENGQFSVYTRDIKGDWDIVLQTKEKNKKKDYQTVLNRLFGPVPLLYKGYETRLRERNREKQSVLAAAGEKFAADSIAIDSILLQMSERDHLLQSVTVTAKTPDIPAPKVDISYDVTKEVDKIMDKGDYVGSSLLEFLIKTNKNFAVYNESGIDYYYYINQPAQFTYASDTMPISYGELRNISLYEVEKIEFADQRSGGNSWEIQRLHNRKHEMLYNTSSLPRRQGGGGSSGPRAPDDDLKRTQELNEIEKKLQILRDGYVRIMIKKYPDGRFRAERKGIRHSLLQGYSYSKEFFSPKYEYTIMPNEDDFRRTLYWNPDVKANKDGKASVSFYNNSSSRQLAIDAETITSSGLFGVYEE